MKINKVFIFLFLCLMVAQSFAQGKPQPANAQQMVRAALEAMGGETKLRELKSVRSEGIGHTYWVEQSERPEGPYFVGYVQTSEARDLANQRVRVATQMKNGQIAEWTGGTMIVANGVAAMERGGRFFPGSAVTVENETQKFAFAPERILLKALDAADLRADKDVALQSVPHKVVKFTLGKTPVTIYLNAGSNLPTAVDTINSSPYDAFWTIWGDYNQRVLYSFWTLEKGGIRYPYQTDTERNGYPYSSFTLTKLELNAPLTDETFAVPEDVKNKFAALPKPFKINDIPFGRPDVPAKEIAPGVVKVAGRWDVAFVKQNDGVVIIEAPLTSGYSAKAIDEAKRRFPGAKIKAVITTSDAFPHLGGVREYAAQNIPIYALDVNRPILERVLGAPHTFEPDLLQNKPRKAQMKYVSSKTVVGEGENRMELYPIRSESGERMMMIYFPEHQLLYASDLIQKGPDGSFFMTQYLSEVMDAVKRENLTVKNIFAMHTELTPWSEIVQAVEKQNR
jgi:hypothetical protein